MNGLGVACDGADIYDDANTTSAIPDQIQISVACAALPNSLAWSCRKNSPNLETAEPTPIDAYSVRIHARKVRFATK
jgi:hypothetical protein